MAPETWDALEAESARTGQSVSDLVREGAALVLAFKAAVRAGENLGELLPAILERLEERER
jgi:hypothetical protein